MNSRRVGAAALVVLALLAGLALRFTRIDARPMHHDEANQAVKFGTLLESGVYRYDPTDHHGPTLYYLSLPAAWARGQRTLAALDERTLRAVPALFGAATILLLPLLAPVIDRTAVVASAWLMALSPAMVFYSRMFIQESLLACCALAFLIAVGRMTTVAGLTWPIVAGVAAGLALATKETSVIIVPAVLLACAISWWSVGPRGASTDGRWRRQALVSTATAAAVTALFYTSFLTAPGAILAPFSAAGAYLSRGLDAASHAHPWHYYFGLLAWSSSGGLRWSEAVVLVLAIVGGIDAWRAQQLEAGGTPAGLKACATPAAGVEAGGTPPAGLKAHATPAAGLPPSPRLRRPGKAGATSACVERRFWARYLTLYVAIVAAILSAIPYKTPWNVLPFYVGTIALAGTGFSALARTSRSRAARALLTAALVVASAQLGWQAWRAAVTYAADPRNPYVYAQTLPDAVRMATRIRVLASVHSDGARMQVSVIASPYEQWPLPWYLRTMPNVGYWTAPGDALAMKAPVIVSSMDHAATLDGVLGERYVSEFYGLRPEVLLALYVDRGLWDRFLAGAAGKAPVAP